VPPVDSEVAVDGFSSFFVTAGVLMAIAIKKSESKRGKGEKGKRGEEKAVHHGHLQCLFYFVLNIKLNAARSIWTKLCRRTRCRAGQVASNQTFGACFASELLKHEVLVGRATG